MIAKRFTTSPIHFDTLEQLEAFISQLHGIRVYAFDFIRLDDPEDDLDDENIMMGDTLKLQIDRDKLEVIVSGMGELKYYDLNKLPEDFKGLPEISDLMDDVFDFNFYSLHRDTVISITTIDLKKSDETQIKLSDYHSKEAYEERLAIKQASISEAKQTLKKLNQRVDSMKAGSKKIQIALHKIEQEAQLTHAF